MKKTLTLTLTPLIFFFFSCKKNNILEKFSPKIATVAYVIGTSGVPLYPKPTFSEKILKTIPINSELTIEETKIPDPIRKGYTWIRVRIGDLEGFISSEEAEQYPSPSISIFEPVKNPGKLYVRASSVRLRTIPSIKGQILTNLKQGEELILLANGSSSEEIDGVYDNWVKVQTKDSKIGYSFSGFLIDPPHLEDSNLKLVPAFGSVEIQEKTSYYKNPGKDDRAEESINDSENIIFSLVQGNIIPVKFQVNVNETIYYYIDEHLHDVEPLAVMTRPVRGWVKASEIKFVKDIFTYTYEKFKSGKPGEDLLYEYLKNQKKKLDFRNVEIQWIEGNVLALVNYSFSTTLSPAPSIHSIFQMNLETKEIKELANLPNNGFWDSQYEIYPNIAATGMPGILYRMQGRAMNELVLYQITPTGLNELLKISDGEFYDEGTEEVDILTAKYDGNQEVRIHSENNNPKNQKLYRFNSDQGKFIETTL